jgi:hypothetical protein
MLTILCSVTGLMSLDCLSQGQKHNKDCVVNVILPGISTTCNHGQRQRVTKHTPIRMNNCKVRVCRTSSTRSHLRNSNLCLMHGFEV